MNKFFTPLLVVFGCLVTNAQVGINTLNPKSSLDIESNILDPNSKDGLLLPRLKGEVLKERTYSVDQHSVLVYITEGLPEADLSGQVSDVSSEGFYYFNGLNDKWTKLNDFEAIEGGINIYNNDGVLSDHRILDLNQKSLTYRFDPETSGPIEAEKPLNYNHHEFDISNYNRIILGATSSTDPKPSLVINPESGKLGIKTATPRTTLHIKEDTRKEVSTGILIPRLSKFELSEKSVVYFTENHVPVYSSESFYLDQSDLGNLVFVYNANSVFEYGCSPDECSYDAIEEVNSDGFYYFNKNGKWKKLTDLDDVGWKRQENYDADYSGIIRYTPDMPILDNPNQVIFTDSGNLGLGTSIPNTKLEVNGLVTFTQSEFYISDISGDIIIPKTSQILLNSSLIGDLSVFLDEPHRVFGDGSGTRTVLLNNTDNTITVINIDDQLAGVIPGNSAKEFYYSGSRWFTIN